MNDSKNSGYKMNKYDKINNEMNMFIEDIHKIFKVMFIQYNFCHLLTLLAKIHKKLVKQEKYI